MPDITVAAAATFTGLLLNLKQTIKSTSVTEGYNGFALNVFWKLIWGTLIDGNLFFKILKCNNIQYYSKSILIISFNKKLFNNILLSFKVLFYLDFKF